MMSEPIILQIPLSEEYDALFDQAREQAGLRKCRCWFDRTAAIGEIRVEITGRDIAIRYETKKGPIEERENEQKKAAYQSVFPEAEKEETIGLW